jgi:hypothetical protein
MNKAAPASSRVFKTAWFGKAARNARIGDGALCEAIRQVAAGQADDLGGGVFKKRLNRNEHRAIILTKAGKLWIFEYLFAKQDRANIDDGELVEFRKLAKAYSGLNEEQIARLLANGDMTEICIGEEE